ncbi:MAG: ABC transporter substrate-binding protein [Clostridiales bacterium]|nr:ABC transporter substrate-binding protein [Clostridiales bacterium]
MRLTSKSKRVLGVVLVVALAFALAACNGGGTTGGGEANDAETIRVGLLGPYTGAVAHFGLAVREGALLYIEQRNAAGGINGMQIEYFWFDDEHDPIRALTGYNWLLDQEVTAIIGGVTSGPTMAVVPQAFEDNMPMITASATHAGVTYDAENGVVFTNMFRACFIDPFQGEKMAEFARNVLEAETAAVIFNTGVDYSIGLQEAFVARAAAIGLEVVTIEAYGVDAVDFTSQLTNIAALNPDVLFIPDYFSIIALMAPQAINAGVTATLLGADGWDGVMDAMTDPSSLEGAFYMSGFSVEDDTPKVQDFITRFMERYGHEPNMFSAQGYDAAMILFAAIEHVENTTDHVQGSDEYRTAVINAMAATNLTGVTGHITYDRFNNPIKTAVMVEIRDGLARFWGTF